MTLAARDSDGFRVSRCVVPTCSDDPPSDDRMVDVHEFPIYFTLNSLNYMMIHGFFQGLSAGRDVGMGSQGECCSQFFDPSCRKDAQGCYISLVGKMAAKW